MESPLFITAIGARAVPGQQRVNSRVPLTKTRGASSRPGVLRAGTARAPSLAWGGVLLLGLGLLSTSCSKSQGEPAVVARDDAVPVTTAAVELIPMDRTLSVVGTLFAKDEAMLGAEVEGKVEKTSVDFGDRVTSGQELAL